MSKSLTMQEIGLENKVHLCKSCCKTFADCNGKNLIYGTGYGLDNIAACSEYEVENLTKEKQNV